MNDSTKKKLAKLMREQIEVVPYDAAWPDRFVELERSLKQLLPRRLVQRIAHIGSTAIPGMSAKPIIDVQVEVNDMDEVVNEIAPRLEEEGYEFIWRRSIGESSPYYAWFIKRDASGERSEHLHIVSPDQASVDRIVFRDHLRLHPEAAAEYEKLKATLAKKHPKDRVAYTEGKSEFVRDILHHARSEKIRK